MDVEPQSQIVFYTGPDGAVRLAVYFREENLWLTQKQMAELFGVEVQTINYHLKEIFKINELNEDSVIRIFRITAADGKSYNTNVYHLDAIISVGYRVNSCQATPFRIWATQTLRELIMTGKEARDDASRELVVRREIEFGIEDSQSDRIFPVEDVFFQLGLGNIEEKNLMNWGEGIQ